MQEYKQNKRIKKPCKECNHDHTAILFRNQENKKYPLIGDLNTLSVQN